MPTIHNLTQAMKSPSTHTLVPGVGYILVGPLTVKDPRTNKMVPAPHGGHPRDKAAPPVGTQNGSWHKLLPPGGHPPMTFQWLVGPKEWFRLTTKTQAKRLGYKPEYLSSHGWVYLEPGKNMHG